MDLPKKLFWDVKFDSIDWDQNAPFVIRRVSQRGTLNDWNQIVAHYGLEKVKEELLKTRFLDNRSLSLFSLLFKKNSDDTL